MQSVPKRSRGEAGKPLRAILKSLYSKLPIQIYTGTHKSVIPRHPSAYSWLCFRFSLFFECMRGRHIYSSWSLMYDPQCMCIIKRGAEERLLFSRRQSNPQKKKASPAARDIIDGWPADDRNVLAQPRIGDSRAYLRLNNDVALFMPLLICIGKGRTLGSKPSPRINSEAPGPGQCVRFL